MAPKWVKYRCACAFEALETTIEAFKMIFCALKRSRIIFYDDEKRWVIWWVIGSHFYILFRSLESIFIVFSLQIAHKMQMTHHLTHHMYAESWGKVFFVKHTNDSPFDSLFDPPQHGCAIFAKNSHGPSVHGVLMTHLLTHLKPISTFSHKIILENDLQSEVIFSTPIVFVGRQPIF